MVGEGAGDMLQSRCSDCAPKQADLCGFSGLDMTKVTSRSEALRLQGRDGHGIPKCCPCSSVVFLMPPDLSVRFRVFFWVASTYVHHTDR